MILMRLIVVVVVILLLNIINNYNSSCFVYNQWDLASFFNWPRALSECLNDHQLQTGSDIQAHLKIDQFQLFCCNVYSVSMANSINF